MPLRWRGLPWGEVVLVDPCGEGLGEELVWPADALELVGGVDERSGWEVLADGPLLPGVEGVELLVGDAEPTDEQKRLYSTALEVIRTNMELMRPGISFEEITRKAILLPEEFRAQRYSVVAHGAGLCDEYPAIRYPEDFETCGYAGRLEPGMVMCVEAYVGAVGGREGVKLEDQVLITETGYENLTHYPFEERLLS